MKDPLESKGAEQELFEAVAKLCHDKPRELVESTALNLLANSIRQVVPYRKGAEARIDELVGHLKTIVLDQHYDSVTGQRRTVIPFTQVLEMPFVSSTSKMFPPRAG